MPYSSFPHSSPFTTTWVHCKRHPKTCIPVESCVFLFCLFVTVSSYKTTRAVHWSHHINGWKKQLAPLPHIAVIWLRMWSLVIVPPEIRKPQKPYTGHQMSSDIFGHNVRIDSPGMKYTYVDCCWFSVIWPIMWKFCLSRLKNHTPFTGHRMFNDVIVNWRFG